MMMPIQRAYVDLEHGQLHYRRAGARSAPTIVLLHQTPSTSAMYEPLMRALADRYQLLALDTPGFGGSDPLPGPFSMPSAAAALAAAARALDADARYWFGHHTGAALALQIASDQPAQVVRLAMSGPCLLDDALRTRLPQLAAPLPVRADGGHLQALWARIEAKDTEAPLALREREVLAGAAAGASYPQAYRAVVAQDTARQLAALDCPTLVFAGTLDPLFAQLDPAFRLLKHGRKAQIANARTFVCERQCAEVAALLDDFFSQP